MVALHESSWSVCAFLDVAIVAQNVWSFLFSVSHAIAAENGEYGFTSRVGTFGSMYRVSDEKCGRLMATYELRVLFYVFSLKT